MCTVYTYIQINIYEDILSLPDNITIQLPVCLLPIKPELNDSIVYIQKEQQIYRNRPLVPH